MRVLKTVASAAAILAVGSAAAFGWSTNLDRNSDRFYRIIAADRTVHRLDIRFNSKAESNVWQTGHVSRPLFGKFRDTRNCHMEMRFNAARLVTAAYNTRTGAADRLEKDFAKSLNFETQDRSVSGFWDTMKTGTFKDINNEINAFDDLIDSQDWHVEDALDPFRVLAQGLGAGANLVGQGISVTGNWIGRMVGLRTGVNCGEIGPQYSQVISSFAGSMNGKMQDLEPALYCLGLLEVMRDWAYETEGGYVPATFVLPDRLDQNCVGPMKTQAVLFGALVNGGPLTADMTSVLRNLPLDDRLHISILQTVLPVSADALKAELNALKPDFDRIAAAYDALVDPELAAQVMRGQFSLSLGQAQATDLSGMLKNTSLVTGQTVTLPSCVVIEGHGAYYSGRLAKSEADQSQIDALFTEFNDLADGVNRVHDRLSLYLGFLEGEPDYEALKTEIDATPTYLGQFAERFTPLLRMREDAWKCGLRDIRAKQPPAFTPYIPRFGDGTGAPIVIDPGTVDPLPDDVLRELAGVGTGGGLTLPSGTLDVPQLRNWLTPTTSVAR